MSFRILGCSDLGLSFWGISPQVEKCARETMKRKMRKLFLLILAPVLLLALLPIFSSTALAADVAYIDAEGETKYVNNVVELVSVDDIVAIDNTLLGTPVPRWYIVMGDITLSSALIINGDVHLILGDGYTLTVNGNDYNAGVLVTEGNSLTVYAQSTSTAVMGNLLATGGYGGAGIGGDAAYRSFGASGMITINGGGIMATGTHGGAGIGGGASVNGGAGGTITINDGTVTAIGGANDYGGGGAGIGGGAADYATGGTGGNIAINGGTITATGGTSNIGYSGGGGAGIGGGGAPAMGVGGAGGIITITGGTVYANGGSNTSSHRIDDKGAGGGAGIGGGGGGAGGAGGAGGTITITGGTYTVTGGRGGKGAAGFGVSGGDGAGMGNGGDGGGSSGNGSTGAVYYLVTFSVSDAGTASGSTIDAVHSGNPIPNGRAIPSGQTIAITVAGAGASAYAYTWSGTASGTGATYMTSVNAAVNAICTVMGTGIEASNITTVAITITAPVTGAKPNTSANGAGNFTVSPVLWTPSDDPFLEGTQYIAKVTLVANGGYTFSGLTSATINGNDAMVSIDAENEATLSYIFPATTRARNILRPIPTADSSTLAVLSALLAGLALLSIRYKASEKPLRFFGP